MPASRMTGWRVRTLVLVAVMLGIARAAGAQTAAPAFATETPVSGMAGSTFYVFLPLLNTGSATASNVQVTSAAIRAAVPSSPAMPLALGTLAAGDRKVLDLRFNDGSLAIGQKYLLTVRGTYQLGAATLGFAVSRIIGVANASGLLQSEIEHWAAMDAISAFQASLPGLDHDADMQSLLAYLQSRPEFVDSGIHSDLASVWARFADGQVIVIADDRRLTDEATAAAPLNAPRLNTLASLRPAVFHRASSFRPGFRRASFNPSASPVAISAAPAIPTELPAASSARLFNTFGIGFADTDLLVDLTSLLTDQKYNVAGGNDATVAALKTVGGEGVFYISSHGGFAGPNNYVVWTSTKGDLATEVTDLSAGRLLDSDILGTPTTPPTLVRMRAMKEKDLLTQKTVVEWHYAFTAQFVRTYWKPFAINSLVYIDACDSDVGSDFKQAMFEKNASVYVGWTFPTPDKFAANTARLVFDRLLGANKFELEAGFKQRAFDYTQVESDLPLHHLGVKGTVEFLNFSRNPDPALSQFALLAPSIATERVDEEAQELHVIGLFGQDPGEGSRRVTVGGVAQHIKSWDPNEIVIDNLPTSGAGSVGEVQVTARQHTSNVAMLSRWQGNFGFSIGSLGSIVQNVTYHLALRADVRKFRGEIHNPPEFYGTQSSINPPGSSATFSCAGSYSETFGATTVTSTWTGSGNLVPYVIGEPAADGQPWFNTIALFNTSQPGQIEVQILSSPLYKGCNTNVHWKIGDAEFDSPGQHSVDAPGNTGLFELFTVPLDSDASIVGKILSKSGVAYDFPLTFNVDKPAGLLLTWGRIAPESPPDPDSAR